MMKRVVMLTAAMVSLAIPALAQQSTPITDQQKHAVQMVIDKYAKAYNTKDAKGIAALYTDDGILAGAYLPETVMGRQAIEKNLADVVQQGLIGSNLVIEADWKSFVPLGNNLIMGTGTWAETVPTPPAVQTASQSTQPAQPPSQFSLKPGDREHGSWTAVYETHGDEVRLRSLSYNVGFAGPTK
jgi:uncharacterized protein (TIGR02246 family)